MDFSDLISLDRGYVVVTNSHAHYPERSCGNRGDLIYPSYEEAINGYLKNKSTSLYTSISSHLNFENVYVLEIYLPNCWIYDTEPVDDGNLYALKMHPKGKKVANYDSYEGIFIKEKDFDR